MPAPRSCSSADPRASERGVALILVLVILPLVAILMVQLSFETAIGSKLADNTLANQQFKQAIRARLLQMRLRLARDAKKDATEAAEQGAYDHPSDAWGLEIHGGDTAARVAKGDERLGDEVALYTEVFDEQGKFNLNLMLHKDEARAQRAREIFQTLLDLYRDSRFDDLQTSDYDVNDVEAREITQAVVRFLTNEQRDDRIGKTELPDPNEEMRQGVFTPGDIVFAHKLLVEKRMMERIRDPITGEFVPGLAELLTVYGDGKINVNTASIHVLRALFREEDGRFTVARNIYETRGGFLNTTEGAEERDRALERRRELEEQDLEPAEDDEPIGGEPFKSLNDLDQVDGMNDSGMLRRNDIEVARDFTVRSNFFTVAVTARRENFLRQQRVVLERHSNGCITWGTAIHTAEIDDLPESLFPEGDQFATP